MTGADEPTRDAREGDSRTSGVDFDRTVRTHDRELRARVARTCRCCPADAEEVTQETWLRAYERRHRFVNEGHLLAWVTLSARGIARDRARSWYRRQVMTVADVPDHEIVDDAADAVVAREQGRGVLSALAALPVQQRRAIWAREVDGRSYAEIAGLLMLSEPAVRSLLHRAREGLRREYARRVGTTLAAMEVTTLRDRISRWVTGPGAPASGAVAAGAVAAVVVVGLAAPPVAGPPDRSSRLVATTGHDGGRGTGPGSAGRIGGDVLAPIVGVLPPVAAPNQRGPQGGRGLCTRVGCADPTRAVSTVTGIVGKAFGTAQNVGENATQVADGSVPTTAATPSEPGRSAGSGPPVPDPQSVAERVPAVGVPGDPMPPGAPAQYAEKTASAAPTSVTAPGRGTGTTTSPSGALAGEVGQV